MTQTSSTRSWVRHPRPPHPPPPPRLHKVVFCVKLWGSLAWLVSQLDSCAGLEEKGGERVDLDIDRRDNIAGERKELCGDEREESHTQAATFVSVLSILSITPTLLASTGHRPLSVTAIRPRLPQVNRPSCLTYPASPSPGEQALLPHLSGLAFPR